MPAEPAAGSFEPSSEQALTQSAEQQNEANERSEATRNPMRGR
jgi:hypothetical protein